uniref:Uncharacterized protein n=1 Tax=Nelumbo nucifera TaxID=4432 RepID=A0A822ZFN9_NELNU|nr:TPA_asm: hypothetical protein HUJ06_003214 [Nelumbo nucifera]DAD44986.1 TPA_asm: hypothetical protein HUJ06_003216 [Nelumbo nucifera]
MQYSNVLPGVVWNKLGWKTDAMTVQGLGLVNPKNVIRFYNDELHNYLASAECRLGAGLGGRVEFTRQYHNGYIVSMSHNTDALHCSKQTAVVRASDDFYPRDPVSHTIHIAPVAYNSAFFGEFMQPDWDMFHSQHQAAKYHGSARKISGGPVYVSDAPGKNNFDLLRK